MKFISGFWPARKLGILTVLHWFMQEIASDLYGIGLMDVTGWVLHPDTAVVVQDDVLLIKPDDV